MALSRAEAERILSEKKPGHNGKTRRFTDEERKVRARVTLAAAREAAAAVARLHRDEHRVLYRVALERRLKEAGF